MKKYDNYKNSGLEWLGEIPEHWEVKKLKYLSEIKTGYTPLTSNSNNFSENGTVWVKPDNLNGFYEIFDSKEKISLKGVKEQNIIKRGSVLVCSIGTIGKFGIAGVDLLTNQQINSITFNKLILNNYGKYLISNCESEFIKWSNGNVVSILNTSSQKNIYFLLPPIQEQTAIANFLDDKTTKIEQAIAIKQKQIELLKERRQILIHKAVTRGLNDSVKFKDSGVEWIGEIPEHWEVKRLKDICSINLNSLPENTNINLEFKYVDIGSVSLENGINNIEEYTFKNAPSRARRIAKKGDTIISTVRTYLKAIDFIDEVKSTYVYSTGFAVLHPKEFIYPEFLGNFVRSDAFTEQVTVNSKGMSYPAINSTDIGRLVVVHCGFEEQKQIVEFIETAATKIATAISLKEQEIEKLKEYKMSLIDGVVTGKVRVT